MKKMFARKIVFSVMVMVSLITLMGCESEPLNNVIDALGEFSTAVNNQITDSITKAN